MEDFGEQVQVGMHFHNGATGWSMHNRLPVLFHQATSEAVKAFERTHPGRRIFYYNRSGYSGTPGSARFEFANFPGDETTDWSRSSGIASLAPDMLNRGIGGAYGFTTDIGGFFDIPYGATSKELFIRWVEWATLSPMFRIHGSVAAGTHTPWSYDAETLRIYKRMSAIHRRAEPLIMRLWKRANRTGLPDREPALAQLPERRQRGPPGPGMDARAKRPGCAGGREGRDHEDRLLPPRLLADGQRQQGVHRPAIRLRAGTARAAPVLHPLRHPSVPMTLLRPARAIG